ncbi:hypothetical protein Baya_3484 [Bagarius yarrelli]|uniref:Secreted protein n=1 Tax=Bagarius yarrelli TaxID=175774 RepID=A0A556TPF1_BAGYA|nr:hypothetical protein Baya_3484 [Bagarius yarrelli]
MKLPGWMSVALLLAHSVSNVRRFCRTCLVLTCESRRRSASLGLRLQGVLRSGAQWRHDKDNHRGPEGGKRENRKNGMCEARNFTGNFYPSISDHTDATTYNLNMRHAGLYRHLYGHIIILHVIDRK